MTTARIEPLKKEEFRYWQARHLLNRAAFGGTRMQIRLFLDWGLEQSVDHLIDMTNTSYPGVEASQFQSNIVQPLTRDQRRTLRQARERNDEVIIEQYRKRRQDQRRRDRKQIRKMKSWWLNRMIETDRPLEEKMTLFYHGHFATGYRTIENSYHLFLQNQLFRSQALGNFGELCMRIIRDPAMLAYLDNNDSNRDHPNENLARELMELFTLGEGIVYTENDIKQGARALTGYTFRQNEFYFNSEQHDQGSKRIFGRSGPHNGDDFVNLILSQNECSEFIAWKLYRFFINDLPNGPNRTQQKFIKSLAYEMRRSHFEMAPVLRTLFTSRHFYETANESEQIKSPVQLVVSATRILHLKKPNLDRLVEALSLMGQDLFMPPSVKGWDAGRTWINTSTLYTRQNILIDLLTGREQVGRYKKETRNELQTLSLLDHLVIPDQPLTSEMINKIVSELACQTTGRLVGEKQLTILTDYIKKRETHLTNELVIELLCLLTAMPEYQLC